MASKPLFIFDFDGTLADTFDLFVESYNNTAPRYRLPLVTPEIRDQLRGMPVAEVIRTLHVQFWKLPLVGLGVQRNMRHRRDTIKMFEGMAPLIKKLHRQGAAMGILSSNRVDTISMVMAAAGLSDCFMFIRSERNHFRKDRGLRSVQRHFPDYELYYVGDQESDVRAARRAHIRSIAVPWGYNLAAAIAKSTPNHMATTMEELEVLLLKLSSSNQ